LDTCGASRAAMDANTTAVNDLYREREVME